MNEEFLLLNEVAKDRGFYLVETPNNSYEIWSQNGEDSGFYGCMNKDGVIGW